MAAGLLPLALYAFGVQTKSKREAAEREMASQPVSYGRVGGEGPVVRYQEGMKDFQILATRVDGNLITHPAEKTGPIPQTDIYAHRKENGEYDLSTYMPYQMFEMAYSNPESASYIANDEERQAKLRTLGRIGGLNTATNTYNFVPGLDFDKKPEEAKKTTKPIYTLIDATEGPYAETITTSDGFEVPRVYATISESPFDAQREQDKYGGRIVAGVRTINPDGTTEDIFETADMNEAIKAMNKAASGDMMVSFQLANGGEKVGYSATTDLPGEDLAKFNNELMPLVAGKTPKQVYGLFDPKTYPMSLRSLASKIVETTTTVDNDGIPAYNIFLRADAKKYINANMPGFAALPGIDAAINQAMGKAEFEAIDFAKMLNAQNGKNSRVNRQSVTGTEGTSAVVVAPEDPSRTPGFDMFSQRLQDENVNAQTIDNFLTENVTLYDDDQMQVESPYQPMGSFLSDYLMPGRVGGDGRPFFDLMHDAINSESNTYSPAQKKILTKFVLDYGPPQRGPDEPLLFSADKLDAQVGLLSLMATNYTGTTAAALMFQSQYNKNANQFGDFKESQNFKVAAFSTAETYLGGFISTYRMPDGSIIPYGSRLGQFVVGLNGVVYAYDEFVKPTVNALLGREDLAPVSGSAAIEAMTSSIGIKNPFQNRFLALPYDQQVIEAERMGVDLTQYRQEQQAASDEIQQMWGTTLEKAREEAGDNEEMLYRLALRGYYRFMSAYALASAVQGGTGGRTISDQDVANFLKAFNTDYFFQNPEIEERVLKHILHSVQTQKALAEKLAGGGSDSVAAMKLLTFPGANLQLTMGDLSSMVGVTMQQMKDDDQRRGGSGAADGFTRANNYGFSSEQDFFDERFTRAVEYLKDQGKTVTATNYDELVAEHGLNETWFGKNTDLEIRAAQRRSAAEKQGT